MNGRKTFWTSVLAGALVGAAVSLFNREARQYSKELASKTGDVVTYLAKNPEQTIQTVKQGIQSVDGLISQDTAGAIQAIEQVESTVQKFTK